MNSNLSNKLVVLILVDRLFQWSENFITREMVELKRQEVELKVALKKIVTRNDLTDDEKDLQNNLIFIPEIPFHALNLWKHFKFTAKHPGNYFRAWFHFFTFRHKRPSRIGRSLLCLFRAASIAEIILTNKINLIHAHFLTVSTETALYLSALTKIPFGCTAHAMDIYKDNSGIRKKLKEASYIVTGCRVNIDYLTTIDNSIRSKLFLVNYGIPTHQRRTMKVSSRQEFIFIAVGRFVEKKGFEYLLEACKYLHDMSFQFICRIVGSGKLNRKLRAQVFKQGIKDIVEFVGYVAPNRMSYVYQTSDVLVVPSIIAQNGDRDGLPNVCIEAMSYGLPIIASRIAGLPEVVIDGVNGRLVPPGDSRALSYAMIEFLNKNNNLIQNHNVNQLMLQQKFDIRKNVILLKKIMLETIIRTDSYLQ